MFKLILTAEQHAEVAEKTYALARAYIQAGCLEEGAAIRANADWHEKQSQKSGVTEYLLAVLDSTEVSGSMGSMGSMTQQEVIAESVSLSKRHGDQDVPKPVSSFHDGTAWDVGLGTR